MNKLKTKLNKLGLPKELLDAKGMTWLGQESGSEDILFYRLPNESASAIETLKNRLHGTSYKWLFVNSKKKLDLENYSSCGEDFYEIRALFADHLYPLENKKIIAITGTNGKTTTVDFIRQLLINEGASVLSIGTLGVYLNDDKLDDFSLTSPDYIDLRKALFNHKDDYDVCALEASSHAIDQKRLYGMDFASLGWTSFSQDHLDYHENMRDYFEAKLALAKKHERFVTSPRAKKLNELLGKKASPAKKVELNRCPGFLNSEFNKINLEVAIGCLKELGIDIRIEHCQKLIAPPGRFNLIEMNGRTFVIDFAHTPDALLNIGEELKRASPDRSIVTVFGCGGDRDRSKRKKMGEAASAYSDAVIVTSDNPRTEDPEKIIEEVAAGVSVPLKKITDRANAIRFSYENYQSAIILLAGKGHEPYIDIDGKKIPYSDEQTVRELK